MRPKFTAFLASLFVATASVGSAQFIDFVEEGGTNALFGAVVVDGNTWINNATSGFSPDSPAHFDGDIFGLSTLSYSLDVYDDDYAIAHTLDHQASFTIGNFTGSDIPVTANSFSIALLALMPRDPGLRVSGFEFVTGDPAFISHLTWGTTTGELEGIPLPVVFATNTTPFTLLNGQTLSFTGNFTVAAIPEPCTYAALAGAAALALACWRRRVERTDPNALAWAKAR